MTKKNENQEVMEIKQTQKEERSNVMNQEKEHLGEDKKKEQKNINDKKLPVKGTSAKMPQYIESLNFPELVDAALGLDGNVIYLIKNQNKLSIDRKWITKDGILVPPAKKNIPFELVEAPDVIYYYLTKMNDDFTLFERVSNYLQKASYLEDEQHLILSLYTFATYLQNHEDIRHLPEMLFFAVPERGKSRTGKAITYISFRGIHTVSVLPASIFRFSENCQATIFFDVMDFWTKVLKKGSDDIFLGRFEKGGNVPRVMFPDRGAFRDTVIYKIFGPTIIASNQAIGNILGTRCMEIQTPYMPGEYVDYKPKDKVVMDLKARLTAWKAKVMDQPLPSVSKIKGIDGRFWDVSKPLLSICKLVCPERYEDLVNALLNQASRKAEDKKETVEGKIVNIIYRLSANSSERYIMTVSVLERLNEGLSERKQFSSQWLGRKLKALGIKTDTSTGRSRMATEQPILEKLYNQYECSKSSCLISDGVDMDD